MDLKEKQIIYIDNKPHIKCNVVMLPTKNESSLWINCENKLKIHIKDRMCPGKQEFQHLYITFDEKLNKDEWYCSPMGIVSRYNGIEKLSSNWRKIIATTDESLSLPQLSKQFIEKYIEEYNKCNIITDVLVEYEDIIYNPEKEREYQSNDRINLEDCDKQFRLKINPKDNTITIKKVKDSYTREEHISNIKKFSLEIGSKIHCFLKEDGTLSISIQDVNKWIEENL